MKEINETPQTAGTGDAGTPASETTGTPAQETTRSQRWEAQKQKEREELEAKYRDAPYLTKIFALHFGRPLSFCALWIIRPEQVLQRGRFQHRRRTQCRYRD